MLSLSRIKGITNAISINSNNILPPPLEEDVERELVLKSKEGDLEARNTLIIHNLPEGILTFLSSYSNPKLGIKLAIAITMHNIPEGIAISVPIYYATKSRKKAFFHSAISGLAEPFGALLAYLFLAKYINEIMIAFILIIVAGLMITLAIEQMFPECLKYHKTKYLNIGLISGVVAVLICLLL